MVKVVWKQAHRRALRETLELVRMDTPVRAMLTIGTPVIATLVAWHVLGQFAIATTAALAALLALGLLIYVFKLILTPSRMVLEERAEIGRLTSTKADAEGSRRDHLIRSLTRLYTLSSDGISPELAAGLELPPRDWLNEQLGMRGEHWSVYEIRGTEYWTFEVTGPAPTS